MIIYPKDLRAAAKRDNARLVTIGITYKGGCGGMSSIRVCRDEELVDELFDVYDKLVNSSKAYLRAQKEQETKNADLHRKPQPRRSKSPKRENSKR